MFLITIVFAKVKKSNNKNKNNNPKNQKKGEKKKKRKKRESFPGLCFKPLRGEAARCPWGSLRAARMTSGPAEAGIYPQHCGVWCGAVWWWEAVGLAMWPKQLAQVRVCAAPCTPQGQAGARLALQVQANRPGSTCLFSEKGRMVFLPGLQLF